MVGEVKLWKPSKNENLMTEDDQENCGDLKSTELITKSMFWNLRPGQTVHIKGFNNRLYKVRVIGFNSCPQVGRIAFFEPVSEKGGYVQIDALTNGDLVV